MNAIANFTQDSQSANSLLAQKYNIQERCRGADMSLELARDSLSLLCEFCEMAENNDKALYSVAGMLRVLNQITIQVERAQEVSGSCKTDPVLGYLRM